MTLLISIPLHRIVISSTTPEMQKYYYDPAKCKTYLEQLGIQYPMVKKP